MNARSETGFGVHDRGVQPRDVVQQFVFHLMAECVRSTQVQCRVHNDVDFGAQGVSDPPQPQLGHVLDAVDTAGWS